MACNELWQIDGASHRLADQIPFWSVEVIDDHSRFLLGITAGSGLTGALTGALAWTAVRTAVASYGLPAWLLSDNLRCFTGRLDGQVVTFERRIRGAGINVTRRLLPTRGASGTEDCDTAATGSQRRPDRRPRRG